MLVDKNAHGRVAFLPLGRVTRKCLKPKDTDFEPKTVGEHIKKRRLVLKLTQTAVARKLGVSQASLINWERGDFQPTRAPDPLSNYPVLGL